MNIKLALKTLLLIAILLLLVIMGLNNRQTVDLFMPPLVAKTKLPAALMYFGFFGVGVLCGTALTAGKKSGGSSSKSKPAK